VHPDTATAILAKVVQRLFRHGILDADDMHGMARELNHDGDHEAATAVQALFVMASVDEAEGQRTTLRIVPDGGNGTT
jgi:hypothetical protein